MSKQRIEIELCVDCVYALANGADSEGIDPDWNGISSEWEGWILSDVPCGGFDPDDLYCEGHFVRPGIRCDGCGTGLGGDRFCGVAVKR